jgi:multiple RNA-binding domain-containing protein 1
MTRSNKIILVKNIPFDTDEKDLAGLFSPYGALDRILLPPAKTIALVDFVEPNDAKK